MTQIGKIIPNDWVSLERTINRLNQQVNQLITASAVTVVDTSSVDFTLTGQQISAVVLPAGVAHDSLSGYTADKHIAHSDVSISAGTGLTGGGTIAANRTLALSFLGIESLADPSAHTLMGWDDTDGAVKFIIIGTNLTYTQATHTLSASGGGGGAPTNAQYVVLAIDATLTDERVLTGTANQITVTDGGAGNAVTLSTPQNIHTAATPTFGGIIIADGGTIGQAAGPLLNFDDTSNYLEITGCNVGIGETTPGARLHLVAGSATAGTAPLRFTSGAVLDTPVAGTVEFLTDAFYATISTGPARKTFAFLESPSFITPTLGAALATSISIDGHVLDSNEWHYLDGQDQAVKTTDSPTFVNLQLTQHAYFDAEVDNGNSGAADTIDWRAGNKQKSTLTASCEYTFTAPTGPCNVILRIIQDGTGGRTVTWPATVKWPLNTAPTLSTAASAVDIIAFYYDGTNYYGAGQTTFGTGGTTQQRDYLLYRDVKAAGTDGGTFTSGAWQTRTLTEETIDTAGVGSLAANQITLAAGVYECFIKCPAFKTDQHQARLYNVTDAVTIVYGSSEQASDSETTSSIILYRFTLAASKVLRVEHRAASSHNNTGFGVANNFGGDECYTVAQFWKIN